MGLKKGPSPSSDDEPLVKERLVRLALRRSDGLAAGLLDLVQPLPLDAGLQGRPNVRLEHVLHRPHLVSVVEQNNGLRRCGGRRSQALVEFLLERLDLAVGHNGLHCRRSFIPGERQSSNPHWT